MTSVTASTQNPISSVSGTSVVPSVQKITDLTAGFVAGAQTVYPSQLVGQLLTIGALAANSVLTIPLPAQMTGQSFRVLLVGTTGFTLGLTSGAANLVGNLSAGTGDSTVPTAGFFAWSTGAAKTNVRLTATAIKGTNIDFTSDGTSWFVKGLGATAAGTDFLAFN